MIHVHVHVHAHNGDTLIPYSRLFLRHKTINLEIFADLIFVHV